MTELPSSQELITLAENDQLAETMASTFGLGAHDAAQDVAKHWAELHNTHAIDLLEVVERGQIQRLPGGKFFLATAFLCKILPELDASSQRMMSCVEALVTHAEDDLAATKPNGALREWFVRRPKKSREVISASMAGNDLASRHLTFALEALGDAAEARKMVLSYSDGRQLSAITALGRISDVDYASSLETLTTFTRIMGDHPGDEIRASMLVSTMAILARRPQTDPAIALPLVDGILKDQGPITLHHAARALWINEIVGQEDVLNCLLKALGSVDPAHKGTLNELDHGLFRLMGSGRDAEAISFVTNFFSSGLDDLDFADFEDFAASLVTGPVERLHGVVVKWLLLGSAPLCLGLARALDGNGMEGPSLDLGAETLSIPPITQVFLCRKAIGWFFHKPRTATSILVSVLRVCDEETAAKVEDLLAEMMLLNFGCMRDYLKGLPSADPARSHVDRALERNKRYLETLRVVPDIREFDPSESQLQIQQAHQRNQMREVGKLAMEKSVISKICRTATLLYGNRAQSFVREGQGHLRPVEMEMKSFGVTFETPRLEIIDPVGLDHILRVFRFERLVT